MRALIFGRGARLTSLGFIGGVILALAIAVAVASGSVLPLQPVPVGKKVFGCVLAPRPPQQQVGPPGMTVRASVRCDRSHKSNFISLGVQKYIPGFTPTPPNYGGSTPNWESRGLPFAQSATPIRARHTYRFKGTHTLDCNSPNGPNPPGRYRTILMFRFPERKHPHRIRWLAAYTSAVNLTCS